MSIKVKSGNPEGVHENIPGGSSKAIVKEFDESEGRSRPTGVITPKRKEKRPRGLEVIAGSRVEMEEQRDTSCPNKISLGYNHGRDGLPWGAEHFEDPMTEALTGETNQMNPFDPPAVGSTKPRTLSEAMTELKLRFNLFMVAIWIPEGYEVVQKQPLMDVKEFIAQARALWDSYEPLLGRRNTTTVLQVEAPPELEDE
jgi:hypothetical protein